MEVLCHRAFKDSRFSWQLVDSTVDFLTSSVTHSAPGHVASKSGCNTKCAVGGEYLSSPHPDPCHGYSSGTRDASTNPLQNRPPESLRSFSGRWLFPVLFPVGPTSSGRFPSWTDGRVTSAGSARRGGAEVGLISSPQVTELLTLAPSEGSEM